MKRNRSKRIIVFIVYMIMLINLAPMTAMAATYQTTIDGVIYQLDDTTLEATVYDTTDDCTYVFGCYRHIFAR